MKKILLVGELNEVLRSLYECLEEDFQIQVCSHDLDTIRGVVRITNPELVVVNQIGQEKVDLVFLEWIYKNYPQLPCLIITVNEEWKKYQSYCEGKQFDKLFRPVKKQELLIKCYDMLDVETEMKIEKEEMKKILIVDDNPLLLRNMKAVLEDVYKVMVATSGEQAIKFAAKKMPDLILLDYDMPELDGKETYEILRQQEETKDIPVIFLTGVADKEQIYAVLESKPAGYILKPPNRERLLRSIEEALCGRKEKGDDNE